MSYNLAEHVVIPHQVDYIYDADEGTINGGNHYLCENVYYMRDILTPDVFEFCVLELGMDYDNSYSDRYSDITESTTIGDIDEMTSDVIDYHYGPEMESGRYHISGTVNVYFESFGDYNTLELKLQKDKCTFEDFVIEPLR